GRLVEEPRALAREIASKAPHSGRDTKRLLRHARAMELEGSLECSAALQPRSHAAPEHAEAVARYLERWRSWGDSRTGGDDGADRQPAPFADVVECLHHHRVELGSGEGVDLFRGHFGR